MTLKKPVLDGSYFSFSSYSSFLCEDLSSDDFLSFSNRSLSDYDKNFLFVGKSTSSVSF